MRRKGFTLVEMLAVIAVLGLLVLLVLPNVLKNYRDSKKISFINEAKDIYKSATDYYVTQRTKGHKVGLIESGGKYELSLSNAEDLNYLIRLDSNGKVTAFKLSNAEYCIVGVGDFLGSYDKEDIIDLSDEEEAAKCEVTAVQDGQKLILRLQNKEAVQSDYNPKILYLKYNVGWYSDNNLKNPLPKTGDKPYVTKPYKENYYYKGAWATNTADSDIQAINCDGTVAQGPDSGGIFIGNEDKPYVEAFSKFIRKYYTVVFSGGTDSTGSMTAVKCEYGNSNCKIPSNVDAGGYGKNIKKPGYLFTGWTSSIGTYNTTQLNLPEINDSNEDTYENRIKFDNEKVCKGEQDINNNVTFTATWTPITYQVAYDCNGGTGTMANTNHTYGIDANLREKTCTRSGYTFAGWARTTDGSVEFADKASVKNLTEQNNAVVTLYAQWSSNKYTVTFGVNGGSAWSSSTCANPYKLSGTTCTKEVTYDGTYGNMPTPVKTGYTFGGWYKETALTNKVEASTRVSTANHHTLYAKWSATQYTVTFNENDGSAWTSSTCASPYSLSSSTCTKSVAYDGTYGSMPTPTRTGYTFAGWYKESSLTNKVETSTKVSTASHHTLYAKWTANSVTATLDVNGGSAWTSSTCGSGNTFSSGAKTCTKKVTYDSTYGTLPTPTRTGYTFAGWYKESSFTNKVETTTRVTNASGHTLYAKWTANSVIVTYNVNGGTAWTSSTCGSDYTYNSSTKACTKSVTYDGTYGSMPTPTRAGYTFGGWYKETGHTNKVETSTNVTNASNHTLYAYWYYTKFAAGSTLRSKMLSLASNNVANIKSFVRSSTLKSGLGNNNVVSTNDSKSKIYMWYESNAIKYYSEDPNIYLNESANTMFNGFYNLTDISGLADVNTSKTTNMESMFQDCCSLNNINPLANWDVSNVTNLHDFFNIKDSMIESQNKLGSLTSLKALKNWNVSKVTTLEEFAQDHPKITSFEGLEDWDVRKVTTLYSAFGISDVGYNHGGRSKLTDISALSGWKTESLNSIRNMFKHNQELTNLDALLNWDVSKVTTMRNAFSYMYKLNNINGLRKWNTSNVTEMNSMFTSDYSLSNIDGLKDWNVSKVTTFEYMFNINDATVSALGVKGTISSLAPFAKWNTKAATNMHAMFQDQLTFTSVAGVKNFNTAAVTSMNSIFGTSSASRDRGYTCTITDKSLLNGWSTTSTTREQLNKALGRCN